MKTPRIHRDKILNADRYVVERGPDAYDKGVSPEDIIRLFKVPPLRCVIRDFMRSHSFFGASVYPGDVILKFQWGGNYNLLERGLLIETQDDARYWAWERVKR